MTPIADYLQSETRRQFFASTGFGLGTAAFALLNGEARAAGSKTGEGAALPATHFPATCKNIIYLHMVGGPSQIDLYDPKPKLLDWYDRDFPESIRNGQRLTTM